MHRRSRPCGLFELVGSPGHRRCLLSARPSKRCCSLSALRKLRLFSGLDPSALTERSLSPPLVPKAETLNCDPTYELEEMIVESRPLHKKKKRLKRQQTLLTQRALQQAQEMVRNGENRLPVVQVGF